MQSAIARQKLAAYPPDTVIEIPRTACRTLEFDRAAEMIALGYRRAKMCDFTTSPARCEQVMAGRG
jgi:NTE family protein